MSYVKKSISITAFLNIIFSLILILSVVSIGLPMFISGGKVSLNIPLAILFIVLIILGIINIIFSIQIRKGKQIFKKYRISIGILLVCSLFLLVNGIPIGLIGVVIYGLSLGFSFKQF